MSEALALLKQYFGHERFHPGQQEIISALLEGRDALGVMPTGAGKSVCYQLPALLLPGITLVVSPLISLMKDQVASLIRSGIPAAYLNSSLSMAQYNEALRRAEEGRYKIIYLAPERLDATSFQSFAQHAGISLLAVDEAHCVSQWGQDFRPGYLKIPEFLRALPRRPIVAAFTATATEEVKEDICRLLELRQPFRLTTGFDRPNLYFDVVRPRRKEDWLLDYLARRPEQSGIIYCSTRKNVEAIHKLLLDGGVSAARYHAGLENEERRRSQDDFVYDRVRVMVATNAFGMGIDKSNVSFVVHYNMPKDLESYYQEAGRAGRDGERAECTLLYSAGDVQTAKFLINSDPENESQDEAGREALRRRDLQRLDRMVSYCKTSRCLRAHLLRYFGEDAPENCGSCGNCTGETAERDMTLQAQKILSAVARVERRFPSSLGVVTIQKMLQGSRDKRVLELGLDQLPTYGIMKELDRGQVRDDIDALIEAGYLCLTEGDYPVLRLRPQAAGVLFRGEKVVLRQRVRSKAAQHPAARAPAAGGGEFFELLRAVRSRLAQAEQVPAYIICTNATLTDMAAKHPRTFAALRGVSGIGAAKAARYGQDFLEAIRAWDERDRSRERCEEEEPAALFMQDEA